MIKNIKKKFIQEQEKALKKEKEKLTEELSSFANRSKKNKGDWDARHPRFGGGSLEDEADEVEEYSTLLALERSLENSLQDVDLALGKIKKGTYGICEKCKKSISKARLKAYPRARYCIKCQQQ